MYVCIYIRLAFIIRRQLFYSLNTPPQFGEYCQKNVIVKVSGQWVEIKSSCKNDEIYKKPYNISFMTYNFKNIDFIEKFCKFKTFLP